MKKVTLTHAQIDLICDMCSIAEANYDIALQNDPVRGEGDYQDWTEADFKRADAIFEKLFDRDRFAQALVKVRGVAK